MSGRREPHTHRGGRPSRLRRRRRLRATGGKPALVIPMLDPPLDIPPLVDDDQLRPPAEQPPTIEPPTPDDVQPTPPEPAAPAPVSTGRAALVGLVVLLVIYLLTRGDKQ